MASTDVRIPEAPVLKGMTLVRWVVLPDRLLPFWVDAGHQNYFDGCIRDERQCPRAYRAWRG